VSGGTVPRDSRDSRDPADESGLLDPDFAMYKNLMKLAGGLCGGPCGTVPRVSLHAD